MGHRGMGLVSAQCGNDSVDRSWGHLKVPSLGYLAVGVGCQPGSKLKLLAKAPNLGFSLWPRNS